MGNRYNQKQDTTNTRLGALSVSAATGAVGTTTSMTAYLKQLVTNQLAYQVTNLALDIMGERCVKKTGATVSAASDDLFTITGGPVLAMISGIVTTVIGSTSMTAQLAITTVSPAATANLSTAVRIDTDAEGTSYRFIGAGVLTPVTAGAVVGDPVTAADCWFLLPIGTVVCLAQATYNTGAIDWFMRYKPLAPLSVVVAAA
jgi:hypothetical protein